MIIRKATAKDVDNYRVLFKQAIENYSKMTGRKIDYPTDAEINKDFLKFVNDKGKVYLLLEDEKILKGYLVANIIKTIWKQYGYIEDIFVLPSEQKKGFGKKLFKEFENLLKKEKIVDVRLSVNLINKNAIKFYEHLGFEKVHFEMDYKIK